MKMQEQTGGLLWGKRWLVAAVFGGPEMYLLPAMTYGEVHHDSSKREHIWVAGKYASDVSRAAAEDF